MRLFRFPLRSYLPATRRQVTELRFILINLKAQITVVDDLVPDVAVIPTPENPVPEDTAQG